MAVDPKGKDSSNLPSLESLIAAGGNSSAARSLRVRSQLRDRLGRWIEMGRDSKLSFLDKLGELASTVGTFLGLSDRDGYGRFYVNNDPVLGTGVYEFPTAAIEQIAATLDENYLVSKNIDVNGNKIKGVVAGEGIPAFADLTRTDLTPEDQDVLDNPVTPEEKDVQVKARLEAPAHESKNVIAKIDAADLEDMRKNNVDWEKYGIEPSKVQSAPQAQAEELGEPRLAFAAQKLAKDVVVGDVLIDSRDVESDPDVAHNGGKVVAVTHEPDLGTAMITIDKGNEDYEDIVRDFDAPVGIDVQESINGGNNLNEEGNAAYEKYKRSIGSSVDSSETPVDEDLGTPAKDEHYDRRRKEFQDTITEANPELAASLFGDNPDAELKKNVEAELDKIDEVPNFSTKYGAYESVAQSLLEGTFTPSADGKVAWYPVVGKDNQSIGILDGSSFYAKPERGRLLVFGDGANNYVESLEQFDEFAPSIIEANKERLIDEAKRNLAVYDTDGDIAQAIDSGATSAEIQPLLEQSPQYLQDRIFAEESQRKNFLSPDERNASNRISSAKTALTNVDKVNKKKPAEKARLEPEQSGLEGVLKKLEDAGIDINNADSEDVDIQQARDTAMHMSDLIEKSASNGNVDKADLYNRLAESLLAHFQNKADGKAAKPLKVVGKADDIQKITSRKGGSTLDAYSLSQPRKGIAVALEGTNEEIVDTIFFDEKLGKLALAEYLEANKDKLKGGFKLGTWHDKDNNEVTLDIIELFPEANQPEAEAAGQERNQQGIFKLSNKDYIDTGGTGDRGRARRERELTRQSGGGSDADQGLGQPDSRGEGRPSVKPTRVSNIPDEWSADRLRGENGRIPISVHVERREKGRELGVILPQSDQLIGVPVTGDANEDAKNFIRASRQKVLSIAADSPREQKKFDKRFDQIERLLAKGHTPLALESLSALGLDLNDFYHSDGRDRWFGILVDSESNETALDLYWYGRTAARTYRNDEVVPQSAAPVIQDSEGFALDVDDLGDVLKKSPTLSKDGNNVIDVAQVVSDLTNSTSTAQTVDTLQQVANSLINGYLKNEDLKFQVGDISKIVDSISSIVKRHKARKQSDHPEDPFHRVDSAPSDGDEDLGTPTSNVLGGVFDTSSIDAKTIGRLNAALDKKINYQGEITTFRKLMESIGQGKTAYDKWVYPDYEQPRISGQRYGFYTSENTFLEIPKIAFDAYQPANGRVDDNRQSTKDAAVIQAPQSGKNPEDEDLGSNPPKTTHLEKLKEVIDGILADEDITEFFDAPIADFYFNKAAQAANPDEYVKAINDLDAKIWEQMTKDEEWHDTEIQDNPLFPFARKLGELKRSAPIDFQKLQENQPDMTSSVSADRLADLELNTRSIDRNKLSDAQKSILRKLTTARTNALTNLKEAAQYHNRSQYEFHYQIALATTKTIKKLVANSEARGEGYNFGSGEADRIDNFLVFEDSISTGSGGTYVGENGEPKVTKMEGLYVSKSGKVYFMKWDGISSSAYNIKKDGSLGQKAGYVDCNWSGESSRGPEFPRSVTPSMLKTYDRYQRDGIGGANITFARLAAEKSGRHYAHSSALTQMGANNSKGIDPADPQRHHVSQQDKVLWMMKAPIFDAMRDNGWFSSTRYFQMNGYNRSFEGFDRKIDPTGYNNDSARMTGPFYYSDLSAVSAMANIRARFQSGEKLVPGEDYPAYLQTHVESKDGNYGSFSMQSLMRELSYKDGKSVDEVLKTLNNQKADLEKFRQFISSDDLLTNGRYNSYTLDKERTNSDNLITFMGELIPLIENNKEKLDNPENRIERPKPFAKDDFKMIKKEAYGNTDGQTSVIDLTSVPKADVVNSAPSRGDNPQVPLGANESYEQLTGKPLPDGWTQDAYTLARKFTEEQLKNSLTNVFTSQKPMEQVYAELDFGRKYGSSVPGYVNPYYVREALKHQIGVDELNSWLAQTADGIAATDANSKALAESNAPRINLLAEMDRLLAKNKMEPYVDTVTRTEDLRGRYSQYKKELGWVTSVKTVSDRYGTRSLSGFYPLLPNNERFDLTNGVEDALGGIFDDNSVEYMDKSRGSQNAKHIAWNFKSEALEDALVDALNNGRTTIQLRFLDTERTQTVPIAAVRDALQHQGVDTNELVKKRVTTIAPPVDEASLNAIGRMTPERPEVALVHGSSTIDITSFERQSIYDMDGVNSPRVMRDPFTKKLYVVKPISSDVEGWGGRARDQEILTQALYRVMGVRASRPQLGVDNSISIAPQEYIVSEFIPETDRTDYERSVFWNPDTNNPVLEAARHGLAADILLDHIDGPFNSGNTVIDEDGNIVRIDGGGGLLWDPVPGHGPKNSEGTQSRLSQENVSRWLANATPEQAALLEKAMRDGTFEGEGIDFSFDFFLNKNGWHWYPNTGIRSRILEGITDEKMKQYAIETVLPLTPDKIETVAGIVRDKGDRERVVSTLISRRQAILDRYGIEDTFMSEEDRMSRMKPTDDQVNLFYHLAGVKITTDAERIPYLAEVNAQFAAGTITSLDIERRILALQAIEKPSTSKSTSPTAAEIDKFVELVYAVHHGDDEKRQSSINAFHRLPYGTDTGAWIRERITDLQKTLAERNGAPTSAADKIAEIEETRTAVIQNGVDTTIYPALPSEASRLIVDSRELKFGDILAETSPEFKELGRVVFNAVGVDGKNTVAYVDKDKRVQFKTYDSPELVETVLYPKSTRPMQSDIPEGQSNRDLRNSIQNLQVARSRVVLDEIKNEYPNHVELENGDLVVSSRTFTTAGGATYRYEVMVHRTPSEEFVSYVRETPLNAAGEVIGATTINKISPETHSAKHLKNRIAPLLVGNSSGKGIHGRNPRNWFNQGNKREIEVIHPATGLPVPRSMAPENLDTKYIGNTGIPVTGDGVKDALIGYVADLVDRKVDLGSLLLRLSNQRIVSRSQINDIIERIQANRRFPGVSQIPYLSRDGENPVRVGDRVRHYMTDGTVKEGVVRKRRPLSVSRKPNGDYGYSDVLVVKFDGRAQGTPIVAKHLEILRRADGSPASIRGEEPEPVVSAPFLPLPESAIAEGIEISDENERFRNYTNTSNGKNGSVTQMPRVYGTQGDRFVGEVWDGERTGRPNQTSQFEDRNVAQAWVLNSISRGDDDITPNSAPASEDEDLGSPVQAPQPSGSKFADMVNSAVVEDTVAEDGSTNISFGTIDGVKDGTLPIYNINPKTPGKVSYWNKKEDLGDKEKAKYIKVPKNASIDEIKKRIMENAEDRLEFNSEGAHTYKISLDDGTSMSVNIDYEEYYSMVSSSVTGKHIKRDGKGNLVFSDERVAEHKEMLEKLLSGIEPPKGRKPKMFFLGGGPASGKGGFTKYNEDGTPGELAERFGIPRVREIDDITGDEKPLPEGQTLGAVVIDPDAIKILLPEVREMHSRQMMRRVEKTLGLSGIFRTGSNDGRWAENAHEESSMIAKMLQQAAVKKELDIVYDGTGDGKRSGIQDKVKEAKSKDYDTVGLYMTTDLPTAIGSAKMRKDRTGRHVPGTTQNDIYFTLANLLNPDNEDGNVAGLFDSWNLIYRQSEELDKKTGAVIKPNDYIDVAHTDENKGIQQDNSPLWGQFLGLGKLSKEEKDDLIMKGEQFYNEKTAERRRKEQIALAEAGKSKIELSDLKGSDKRVMQIRATLQNIAAQVGLPVSVLTQNSKVFSMILNNKPIADIISYARELR